MPQIASKDLREFHSLMMQAHRQYEKEGYEVWADTIHMAVYRKQTVPVIASECVTEWTRGAVGQDGKLLFRPVENSDDT